MLFGRVSSLGLVQQLTYTFVALGFAVFGFGVLSLIIARLVSGSVKTILSWILCPGWNWIIPVKWDTAIAKELLTFGIPSMWSGLLNYFHTHWDDWLVGRVLGEAMLGFYTKAYDLTNSTIKQFSDNVIGAVFFPSYTKIQDDHERLSRVYIKSVQLVMLIVAPLAFGAMSIAPELVRVLWGITWVPMIPILQILWVYVDFKTYFNKYLPLIFSAWQAKLQCSGRLCFVDCDGALRLFYFCALALWVWRQPLSSPILWVLCLMFTR